MQKSILGTLAKRGVNLSTMLDHIVDIMETGTAPNPVTGAMEQSDKLRLEATKLLLELAGFSKNKQVAIQFSLTKLVYGERS